MARSEAFFFACILFFFTLCSASPVAATHPAQEQISLNFSVHEIGTGQNATLLMTSGTGGMGTTTVFDNTVHEGQSLYSKLLGRATGWGRVTTLDGMDGGLQIESQITFGEGSVYNGSSILFMGSVLTPALPWEVVVVGGTGRFRGIQGYAYVEPGPSFPPTETYKWSMRAWKWAS